MTKNLETTLDGRVRSVLAGGTSIGDVYSNRASASVRRATLDQELGSNSQGTPEAFPWARQDSNLRPSDYESANIGV